MRGSELATHDERVRYSPSHCDGKAWNNSTLNMSRIDTAVLNLTTALQNTSAKVKVFAVCNKAAKSYTPEMGKRLVASARRKPSARILVVRETPKAIYPKSPLETKMMAEKNHSGMGKVIWIIEREMGNPHANHLSPLRKGYGEAPETERDSVIDDRLSTLRWLKIQSIPVGKLTGIEELQRKRVR